MDKVFGDFTLIKPLGKGTLGSVFLAEHRFIKKTFVLKILAEELSQDSAFIKRFELEVGALAALDHPNIVKTHNVSFTDGQYYLVTDCIKNVRDEPTNLAQHLKKNLSETEIYEILSQVASALDYAHKQKIGTYLLAHRSLKLNNILVGRDRFYISDFGLAKLVGEGAILTRMYRYLADALSVDISKDGYFLGHYDPKELSKLHISFMQHYAFLSPEQRIFRENSVGVQADMYAFGVLAYFLLMRAYPEGSFPLPSKGRPEFKFQWDEIIVNCLNPSPAKRPSSLMQLMEDIRHAQAEPQEVRYQAPPPPPVSPLVSPYRTQQAPAAAAVKTEVVQQHMIEKVSSMVRFAQPKPIIRPAEIERPSYDPDPAAAFKIETAVTKFKPQEEPVPYLEPIQAEMILIPGGKYFRGSEEGARDERPRHPIILSDFAIDIHPVTNEAFLRFLEVMGGEKDSNNHDIIKLQDCRIKRINGRLCIESGYAKHPVIAVTWYGAVAYAKWAGKRLPREAEYEVACRGGLIDSTYPTGGQIDNTQANFFNSDTTPVMSYPPNGYGLYDMVGNVYQWCQDWYNYDYYEVSTQEPHDPMGPMQGVYRVLRGGCWKSLEEDLRCAHRHRNNPATANRTYGFRCATDVAH
ncbi:MAG: SUMF1/EgtB/PvdO family nonheme iron enzyme [Simkaniaceae bacterium]|nr:SUMF1/EgtB/PvdO family nonheme iron enzyme [Simkaniaceae bacterium]